MLQINVYDQSDCFDSCLFVYLKIRLFGNFISAYKQINRFTNKQAAYAAFLINLKYFASIFNFKPTPMDSN